MRADFSRAVECAAASKVSDRSVTQQKKWHPHGTGMNGGPSLPATRRSALLTGRRVSPRALLSLPPLCPAPSNGTVRRRCGDGSHRKRIAINEPESHRSGGRGSSRWQPRPSVRPVRCLAVVHTHTPFDSHRRVWSPRCSLRTGRRLSVCLSVCSFSFFLCRLGCGAADGGGRGDPAHQARLISQPASLICCSRPDECDQQHMHTKDQHALRLPIHAAAGAPRSAALTRRRADVTPKQQAHRQQCATNGNGGNAVVECRSFMWARMDDEWTSQTQLSITVGASGMHRAGWLADDETLRLLASMREQ